MSELQGVSRFRFHEDAVEEFKRLAGECIEIARTKDTGTLQYEVFFSGDDSECIVIERYRDSEALIEHATNLGELGEAIVATGLVSSALLGEPSADLRAKLAGSPVGLFTLFLSI
jgi:quinol monooxygenase YgiN